MSFESLASTHIVTFERRTNRQGALGGISTASSWLAISDATEMDCTIQPPSHREKQLFAQRQILYTHKCYMSTRPALRRDDRAKVDNWQDSGNCAYFRVTGITDMGGRARYFIIELVEWLDD